MINRAALERPLVERGVFFFSSVVLCWMQKVSKTYSLQLSSDCVIFIYSEILITEHRKGEATCQVNTRPLSEKYDTLTFLYFCPQNSYVAQSTENADSALRYNHFCWRVYSVYDIKLRIYYYLLYNEFRRVLLQRSIYSFV